MYRYYLETNIKKILKKYKENSKFNFEMIILKLGNRQFKANLITLSIFLQKQVKY